MDQRPPKAFRKNIRAVSVTRCRLQTAADPLSNSLLGAPLTFGFPFLHHPKWITLQTWHGALSLSCQTPHWGFHEFSPWVFLPGLSPFSSLSHLPLDALKDTLSQLWPWLCFVHPYTGWCGPNLRICTCLASLTCFFPRLWKRSPWIFQYQLYIFLTSKKHRWIFICFLTVWMENNFLNLKAIKEITKENRFSYKKCLNICMLKKKVSNMLSFPCSDMPSSSALSAASNQYPGFELSILTLALVPLWTMPLPSPHHCDLSMRPPWLTGAGCRTQVLNT